MKLEGSLDAFSLPDMFQLLSFTRKTGGLHLAHGGSDGVVFFAGGQVTGASADSSRQPLARRLVGSGTVDDDALVAAVGAATSGEGVGVVRALLDQGVLDADLLRRAATEQSVDAVFDLLRWADGDFAFVVDEPNPDDIGVTISVESVLADTEARKSAWEAVSQIVPSPGAVLAMPVVLPADPQVSREEWSLLALVDGRRTVTELVDLTGSGQYAVVSTLAGLVTRGLLEGRPGPGSEDAEDHVAVVVRRQQLLAPLEGEPFVPVTDEAVAAQAGPAEVGPPAHPAVKAVPVLDPDLDPDPEPGPSTGPDAPADTWSGGTPETDDADAADDESSQVEGQAMLGGAHVPQDVVPQRPEPFLPRRQADFAENAAVDASGGTPVVRAGSPSSPGHHHGEGSGIGDVVGATATAADPNAPSVIERDPNVNRSLMLRLIAGVRGL